MKLNCLILCSWKMLSEITEQLTQGPSQIQLEIMCSRSVWPSDWENCQIWVFYIQWMWVQGLNSVTLRGLTHIDLFIQNIKSSLSTKHNHSEKCQ